MAELIFLCQRSGTADIYTDADLETVANRILPANAPRNVEIVRSYGCVTCRINAPKSLPIHGMSTCLGCMIPPTHDWHTPGAPAPDGSYGIVRTDGDAVELVSDATASRTIYYRCFENRFIASTSQRAIVHFDDDFVLDEAAVAWMISSGSLGPNQRWDARIGCVRPDTRIRLDRSKWEVTKRARRTTFDPTNEPESVHRDRLVDALHDTFDALNIDTKRWELPLSGGLDSRELLLQLRDRESLRTFTWGTEAALDNPDTDAVCARKLADACDVPHRYYMLPEVPKDIEKVFDRFIIAGEGRIDHVSGYLDGFEIFEDLSVSGVDGLIRGDEGFGWRPVSSSAAVRNAIGAATIDDHEMLPMLLTPGAAEQELPERLARQENESLATWRDRLYHTHRVPVVLGALTALKTPYIEVVNPFLTHRVLKVVRGFPDEHRTNKRLYAAYVNSRSPDVPVATQSANPDGEEMLASENSRTFLKTELDTINTRSTFGNELVEHALKGLYADGTGKYGSNRFLSLSSLKRQVGGILPKAIIQCIEAYTPINRPALSISGPRLAFRMYIIKEMIERLKNDAGELRVY